MRSKPSGATGIPDHLVGPAVQSVAESRSAASLPRPNVEQYLPSSIQGLDIPIDPLLQWAGAYYRDSDRALVRKVVKHAGPPREVNGRVMQPISSSERLVAPPGMTLNQARDNGLDFFSPQFGWIRAGLKIEREHPDNLGTGGTPTDVEWVDVEAPDASGEA
jgi:hypothetical protein